ncbi:MAG: class I SAM-dependent methyltransferase [Rhodobacteraceae bacterium]|nr:class I SAM-dependent methyltransferase [Paracoccaceae bacterium]
MAPEVFFQLHTDLPREGPGEAADVAWAASVAGLPDTARVLDAASGPGGDIGALLRAAPLGHVTATDLHAPFIEAARRQFSDNPRVTLLVGDMLQPQGPFDLIWCAGAVYFVGIEAALAAWRGRLAPGGHIAFSEPCFFTDAPSDGAIGFWHGEGGRVGTKTDIIARVAQAGYRVRATRRVSDTGWECYYRPMEARIARLRTRASPALQAVLNAAEVEITAWRQHREETGYVLLVVAPE